MFFFFQFKITYIFLNFKKKNDLDQLKRENFALKKELELLKKKKENIPEALNEINSENHHLKSENFTLKQTNKHFQEKISKLNSEIEVLKYDNKILKENFNKIVNINNGKSSDFNEKKKNFSPPLNRGLNEENNSMKFEEISSKKMSVSQTPQKELRLSHYLGVNYNSNSNVKSENSQKNELKLSPHKEKSKKKIPTMSNNANSVSYPENYEFHDGFSIEKSENNYSLMFDEHFDHELSLFQTLLIFFFIISKEFNYKLVKLLI